MLRRIHSRMKLRLSISAINPSVFVLTALPEAAQTNFFVASGSFQGLNQRLSLVKLDKTDIVTHVQPPSSKSGRARVQSLFDRFLKQAEPVIWPGIVL